MKRYACMCPVRGGLYARGGCGRKAGAPASNNFLSMFLLIPGMMACLPSLAAVICVDARNLTGSSNGSPEQPYTAVQAGVDAAVSGDTVQVAAGVYQETVRIEDKTVFLLGGFAGGSTGDYQAGTGGNFATRDPALHTTELQADIVEAVVTLLNAGESVVEGFRITGGGGGSLDLPYGSKGGGIFVRGGAPRIRNNLIEQNDAQRPEQESFGGGIYSDDANVIIEDNIIRDNTAGRGAGIAAFGGTSIRIAGNTINGNVGVSDHGGGIYVGAPDAVITRNQVFENEIGRDLGYGWGGGILVFNPGNNAHLSHNRVYRNYSPGQGAGIFVDEGATAVLHHELVYENQVNPGITGGGAVYVDGGVIGEVEMGSTVSIINCTIANNPAVDWYVGGNGLLIEGGSSVTVRNTLFWGNGGDDFWVADEASSLTMTYSNSEEALAGTGNTSLDPLFADPASGDFHLRSAAGRWDPAAEEGGAWVLDSVTSPAIDAGNPADPFANEPAPNGGRINMGAFGNTPEASKSTSPGGEGEGEGESLSDQEFAEALLDAFTQADVDGNGLISFEEAQTFVESLGFVLTQAQFNNLLRAGESSLSLERLTELAESGGEGEGEGETPTPPRGCQCSKALTPEDLPWLWSQLLVWSASMGCLLLVSRFRKW